MATDSNSNSKSSSIPSFHPTRIRSPKGIYVAIFLIAVILFFVFPAGLVLLLPFFIFLWRRVSRGKLLLHEDDIVLFWGLPGSGKTLSLTKTCLDNKKRYKILGNKQYDHCTLLDGIIRKDEIGVRDSIGCLIVWDEASLNGYDNRDWQHNFTPESLEYFKRHRQFHSPMVFTNQGWNELDVKIRDGLCNKVYYCYKNRLLRTCTAVRLYKCAGLDQAGQILVYYRQPTWIDRLVDPGCVLRAKWKVYGQYYQTAKPKKFAPPSPAMKTPPVGSIVKKKTRFRSLIGKLVPFKLKHKVKVYFRYLKIKFHKKLKK